MIGDTRSNALACAACCARERKASASAIRWLPDSVHALSGIGKTLQIISSRRDYSADYALLPHSLGPPALKSLSIRDWTPIGVRIEFGHCGCVCRGLA